MTMILRLTDGSNTRDLIGGPVYLVEYVPRGPELSVIEFEPATVLDGGEVAAITRRNVTEQCDVTIFANTLEEVQETLQGIEALFMQAIEFQTRRGGSQVWLELATDGVTVYRSEILYGRVELAEKPLQWLDQAPGIGAALIWRRRYYWEGDEVTLDIANVHGSGTGGVTVYNALSDSYDNFIDILGEDVVGVLPTPARIEIQNTAPSGVLEKVIVGHNVYADPGDLWPVLEGEDASTAVGSVDTDVSCTGDAYMALALTDSREALLTWTISSEELSNYRGRFFRLWLRCQEAPSAGVYLLPKMILGVGSLQIAAEGQETLLDSGQLLQDLGVLQVPPYLMGASGTFYQMDLALYGRQIGGGGLNVDFLYLMPLDSYRELRPRGYGAAENITLVDDGIADRIWAEGYGGGTELIGLYYGLGPRVMLVPGRQQRLHFLMTNTAGGCEIDRTAMVVVRYRPRRVTV